MSIARMLMLAGVVALTQPVWTLGAGGDADAATVGYRYTGAPFTRFQNWSSSFDDRVTGEMLVEFHGPAASAPWRDATVAPKDIVEARFGFSSFELGEENLIVSEFVPFELGTGPHGLVDQWYMRFSMSGIDEVTITTLPRGDSVVYHDNSPSFDFPRQRAFSDQPGTWRVISLDGEAIDELPPPVVIPAPPAALLFVSALLGFGFFGARSRTK